MPLMWIKLIISLSLEELTVLELFIMMLVLHTFLNMLDTLLDTKLVGLVHNLGESFSMENLLMGIMYSLCHGLDSQGVHKLIILEYTLILLHFI